MDAQEESNLQILRDCLSDPLIAYFQGQTPTKTRTSHNQAGRKRAIKPVVLQKEEGSEAENMADFIEYLSTELFNSLPPSLRTLTYTTWLNTPRLSKTYSSPSSSSHPTISTFTPILNALSSSIEESLTTYALLPAHRTAQEFLLTVLTSYLEAITTPPPPAHVTRKMASICEICERGWIPLTFHHLIPRDVHARVLKRGWHTEDRLQNVAWLCRACHSYVHSVASNEELAREWFTVERLMEKEDVKRFAAWVGKIRWKAT